MRLVLCVLLSCRPGVEGELSDDWVVEVEGGLEDARRLAAETDTDLLGEVLPGSQLYHLRQRRRLRREVEGDHRMENLLEEDSLVRSFSHLAVLKESTSKISDITYIYFQEDSDGDLWPS